MAVNSGDECQNVHSVMVLVDGGATNLQYEPLSNISYLEVPNLMKNVTCLISETNLQNHSTVAMEKVNNCAPLVLDVDIEKGMAEIPKFNEESVASLKSDDFLARALLRENFLQIGGKFMQLLLNHGADFPKFISRDWAYDTPTTRLRKYKRSPSFNSRRVLLLFSVLSSVGTIILIYLTLRVKQISDGANRV